MARLGLIEEDIVLPEKDGFILCDENGVGRVTLLSVIGKGGTAIAYKAIRRRNGSTVTCIVKEYFLLPPPPPPSPPPEPEGKKREI